ncbi:MAG: DEAD/DEAH box helicase [Thermomicrobiales bacterium]
MASWANRGRPPWRRSGPKTDTSPDLADGDATAADDVPGELDLFDALVGVANDGDEADVEAVSGLQPATKPEQSSFDLAHAEARARFPLERAPTLGVTPRPYQDEALAAWLRHDGRGVVALPTGAGKTVVALMAVARLGVRTLVVVPTIDLLHQWRGALVERLDYPLDAVGIVGGGKRTVRDLTVITYDSAAMPSRRLDDFGLLIVDEVHHLPARAYQTIARKVNAPFRLGLSATPERADFGHLSLPGLIGEVVYRREAAELAAAQHLAAYDERRIFVNLAPEEQIEYDRLMAEYKWYLASRRGQLGRGEGMYQELIRRSGHDPAARSALRSHQRARVIALSAGAKIERVAELLDKHRDEKVIVFSEYNAMVDELSERLLLPAITYRTPLPERRLILDRFRAGAYSKLVTGRVLNEGVDVPDASVAVVVSGSSATREYIQRLGRILRPKRETAVLYELVTRRTVEGRSARKRRPNSSPKAA